MKTVLKKSKYLLALLLLLFFVSSCMVSTHQRSRRWVQGHYEMGAYGHKHWVRGHYVYR